MSFVLLSGSAHSTLSHEIAAQLGIGLGEISLERFPDGEVALEILADVRGRKVVVVQPLCSPVGENLLELALISDACRRGGATEVTAAVSYLGYARQDRRERGREPLGSRVMAELLSAGRIDRLVVLDLHSRAVEGCFLQPVEHATAVPLLVERLRDIPQPAVVISPDLGAVKRAEAYARLLGLNVAVVHKHRLSGAQVEAQGVVGDVKGLFPLVVDDMISTGGTMAASIRAVLEQGAQPQVTIAATHGLFVGDALKRLSALPLRKVVVSNSLPSPKGPRGEVLGPRELGFTLETVSAAPVLADLLKRCVT